MKLNIPIGIVILFSFSLLSQSFGPFSPELSRSLAFLSLLTLLVVGLKRRLFSIEIWRIPLLLLSLSLVLRGEGVLGILGVGLFAFSLSSKEFSLTPIHLFSIVSSIFFSLQLASPLVFIGTRRLSFLSSGLFGANFGPSISSLPLLFSFFFLWLSLFLFSDRKRAYLFLLSLIGLGASYFLYLFLLKSFPFAIQSLSSEKLIPWTLVPFLLYSLSLLTLSRSRLLSRISGKSLFSYVSLLFFLLGVFLFFYQSPPRNEKKSIYISKLGLLDFELPKHGNYGSRSAGKFGLLVELLKAHGFEVKIGDLSDPLQGNSVLVFINMNVELDDETREKISRFVKEGGSLLVLADHTNIANSGDAQNQILEPLGGKIKFDSAKPFRYGWLSSLLIFCHPITSLVRRETEIHHWIGASVDLEPPYYPLLVGRYAFSDRGNRENPERAFLGNMIYDPGEEVGDLIVAGYKRVGRGRILLFGDTSSFQNPTLYSTYPFVLATFLWLSSPYDRSTFRESIALILVAFALLLFPFMKRKEVLGALFLIVLTLSFFVSHRIEKRRYRIPLRMEKIALVDFSHGERFDLMGWEDESIGGLLLNTMRNGYFPVISRSFDPILLERAKCLFVISPTRNFSKKELRTILSFVRKGGYLFLSVGWEEKEGSISLLETLRLDVENIPLGRTRARSRDVLLEAIKGREERQQKKVPFEGDLLVEIMEGWPVVDLDTNSQTLLLTFGYPVVVFKKIGKGGVFLIGDSYFLLNPNLESLEGFKIGNIAFLRALFEKMDAQK